MNSPKISVIVPIYNPEKYLAECIDSIISQTLEDIEIICINDGSTDNSLEILHKYQQKDNRIIVIDKKNEGVGKTRNYGILHSSGKFVAFIDPDDKYPTNDILETLYTQAIENNVKICGGEFAFFTNRNPQLNQKFSPQDNGYKFNSNQLTQYKDYQFDYGYHRFLYDRKFLIENKIFYPYYKRFQDPPFFVNAMITAGEFYALTKITYAYRCGHNKITWTTEKVNDMLSGALDNFKYAHKHNLEKLSTYTLQRVKDHYQFQQNALNWKSLLLYSKMQKYNPEVKAFRRKNNLFIKSYYIKPIFEKHKKVIQQIFSITNSKNKKYKVVTLFGVKLKLRRSNAI